MRYWQRTLIRFGKKSRMLSPHTEDSFKAYRRESRTLRSAPLRKLVWSRQPVDITELFALLVDALDWPKERPLERNK
jgi:hypothetical protein